MTISRAKMTRSGPTGWTHLKVNVLKISALYRIAPLIQSVLAMGFSTDTEKVPSACVIQDGKENVADSRTVSAVGTGVQTALELAVVMVALVISDPDAYVTANGWVDAVVSGRELGGPVILI